MSDNYDFDDEQNENGPKALRELVDKLKKEAKTRDAELAALKEQNQTLSGQVKKSSLAELLKAAGVPEKFASRADKDGAEATTEGVKAWIDENKDFYNFGAVKAADEQTEPDGQTNVSPELEAQLRQSQALDASGVTPSDVNIVQKIQSLNADSAANEDQLLKELRDLGVEIG